MSRRASDVICPSHLFLPTISRVEAATGCFAHKLPSSVCTKAAFLAAAARGKGLPAPWKVYGTVTEPLICAAKVPPT